MSLNRYLKAHFDYIFGCTLTCKDLCGLASDPYAQHFSLLSVPMSPTTSTGCGCLGVLGSRHALEWWRFPDSAGAGDPHCSAGSFSKYFLHVSAPAESGAEVWTVHLPLNYFAAAELHRYKLPVFDGIALSSGLKSTCLFSAAVSPVCLLRILLRCLFMSFHTHFAVRF